MKKYFIILSNSMDNRYFVERNTLEEAKKLAKAYQDMYREIRIVPCDVDDIMWM